MDAICFQASRILLNLNECGVKFSHHIEAAQGIMHVTHILVFRHAFAYGFPQSVVPVFRRIPYLFCTKSELLLNQNEGLTIYFFVIRKTHTHKTQVVTQIAAFQNNDFLFLIKFCRSELEVATLASNSFFKLSMKWPFLIFANLPFTPVIFPIPESLRFQGKWLHSCHLGHHHFHLFIERPGILGVS